MTIVRLNSTEKEYVLLGTGFGMFKAQGQAGWGKMVNTSKGDKRVVALSNEFGQVLWADSNDITVVSVDGVNISKILK